MSSVNYTRNWLISNNKYQNKILNRKNFKGSKIISIASGKGGVGKTSISLKISKMLADSGYKVILIDCDHNLSNSSIKLNIPVTNNFYSLVSSSKSFEECLYKDGNFNLLSGCNGNLDLLNSKIALDKFIIDIISVHKDEYDFVLLDCPAGLSEEVIALNAYSDYRIIIVTPDKSSITDAYSIMKILNKKYSINENHLIINKNSSNTQYCKIIKSLSETVESFLNSRLCVLGGIKFDNRSVDLFDKELLKNADSFLHKDFCEILKKITDEFCRSKNDNIGKRFVM